MMVLLKSEQKSGYLMRTFSQLVLWYRNNTLALSPLTNHKMHAFPVSLTSPAVPVSRTCSARSTHAEHATQMENMHATDSIAQSPLVDETHNQDGLTCVIVPATTLLFGPNGAVGLVLSIRSANKYMWHTRPDYTGPFRSALLRYLLWIQVGSDWWYFTCSIRLVALILFSFITRLLFSLAFEIVREREFPCL